MTVDSFVLIGTLGLVVLWAIYEDYQKAEKEEENWRHEFTLSMQAKKPLFVSTRYIEGLANYYIDSGEYLRINPFEAANRELRGLTGLKKMWN